MAAISMFHILRDGDSAGNSDGARRGAPSKGSGAAGKPTAAEKPTSKRAPPKFDFAGRHLLASYSGCDPAAIRDVKGISAALVAAVKASGATLLSLTDHVFPPDGMTAVVLLSESHASIHTYPEHSSCFVDIFTCGTTCKVEAFDAVLRSFLRPRRHSRRIIARHEQMVDEAAGDAEAA